MSPSILFNSSSVLIFENSNLLTKPFFGSILIKLTSILSILLISTLWNFALSQDKTNNKEIITAIQKGDYLKLADNFNTTIDLQIGKTDGNYSKTQAKQILKDFFKKYPPKSFKIIHEGSSKNSSEYIIGSYNSEKKEFRVYILLKKINSELRIHILQFEEE